MLAATFTLTNCTKEIQTAPEIEKTPYTIFADAAATKTANDGLATEWVEGDALNVFHAAAGSATYSNSSQFTLTDAATGQFDTEALEGELAATNDWYALYPYNKYVTTPASTDAGYIYIGNKNGLSQEEYGSTSHLAGSACPLYGVAKAVSGDELPAIRMHHLTSVVQINVKNGTSATFAINELSFTASAGDIVGHYFADFTQNVPVLTPRENNVSNTALLTVTNPADLAPGATAVFYLVVKPFTAPANSTLSIKIGSAEKTITLAKDEVFAAGKINGINYTLNEVPVEVPPTKATVEDFLAAAEDDTWYELTGTIENIVNTTYGNFDLTDATGTVYVYGLTKTKVASNDKSFASIGLKEGDVVTLIGKRASYKGTAQVDGPAYYVSHVAGEEPEPEPEPGDGTATFDFNANEWGLPVSATGTESDGNIVAPVKSGDVTMTVYNGTASTATRLWQGSSKVDLRAYKNSSLAFSVPNGYVITKMTFSGSKVGDALFTPANGTYASKVWEGKSNPVLFTINGTINVDNIVVEYEQGTGESPELPEESEPDPDPDPTPDPTPGAPASLITATVAEFIAAAESTDTWYKLTGEIVSIAKETYGNFTIKDATGEVYIYGMTNGWVGKNDQSFSSIGLKVGDVVTLGTLRGSYNGTPQGGGNTVPAYYISHVAGTTPTPEPGTTADVTIDLTTQGYTNATEVTGLTVDGVTVAFDKGSNTSNAPKWYDSGSAVRVYAGNTFAISASKAIASIKLIYGTGDSTNEITTDVGTFSTDTWTGSANNVVFTIGGTKGNRRLVKIEVVYN